MDTHPAIRAAAAAAAALGEEAGRIFCFFSSSSIIWEQPEAPGGSRRGAAPGPGARGGRGLLFPFLDMMDYSSISSSSRHQPCLSAATPIWQI